MLITLNWLSFIHVTDTLWRGKSKDGNDVMRNFKTSVRLSALLGQTTASSLGSQETLWTCKEDDYGNQVYKMSLVFYMHDPHHCKVDLDMNAHGIQRGVVSNTAKWNGT